VQNKFQERIQIGWCILLSTPIWFLHQNQKNDIFEMRRENLLEEGSLRHSFSPLAHKGIRPFIDLVLSLSIFRQD